MEQLPLLLSIIAGTAGGVWTLALFNSKQNASLKTLIYEQFDKMLARLESHEKHDNSRFSTVYDRLWELRLDTAGLKRNRGFDQETESFRQQP